MFAKRITISDQLDILRGLPDPQDFLFFLEIDLKMEKADILDEFMPIIRKNKTLSGFEKTFCEQVLAEILLPKRYFQILEQLKKIALLKRSFLKDKPIQNWDEVVDRARHREITDVVTLNKLRKSGNRWQALCPLHHEKTPSFIIFPDGKWKCFGCGKHGDVIDLFMEINGVSFTQAVKELGGGL